MSETLYATPAQVLAAKLAVELSEEEGKEPDEALRAIANATVVSEEDALSEAAGVTANPREEATDEAKLILNHAQQLADSLIDEAMASARSLLLEARSQQRAIMERAEAAATETTGPSATAESTSTEDPPVDNVEYTRMFARVAQMQVQAVAEALSERIERLEEVVPTAQAFKSGRGSEVAS
jgi:hypothetical protein